MGYLPKGYPSSTYCSDPELTHVVGAVGAEIGAGVFGWYTSEFDANRVNKYLNATGNKSSVCTIKDYKERERTSRIHPLILAQFGGYV